MTKAGQENAVLKQFLSSKTVKVPFDDGTSEEVWLVYENDTWRAYAIGGGGALAQSAENPAGVCCFAAEILRYRRKYKAENAKKNLHAKLDELEERIRKFKQDVTKEAEAILADIVEMGR